ncbi:MAG: DUF2243 domain-containing protein [Planctomycetota bacterium]|nr:DUF2243 domain-containing protein [Planctomycetota bacterium]
MSGILDPRPLATASVVLGVGMGGFVDGIVLHQILQVHNMVSARLPPESLVNVEAAMVWDGVFHVVTWAATGVGVVLLYRAARRPNAAWSARLLIGGLLVGWGLFNLIEGIINHHLLGLHHVVERLGPSIYDVLFLLSGVALVIAGGIIARGKGRKHPPV